MDGHSLSGTSRLPLGFAHRGGRQGAPNTLAAFSAALAAGARGLETDVWLTADRVPVLLHPRLPFRNGVGRGPRARLPVGVPTIAELYEQCGADYELALDMAAPGAVGAVVDAALRHDAVARLWLTYWRIETLARWRVRWPSVRLVYPAAVLPWRDPGPLLNRLAAAGVDALNLHHRQVSAGMVRQARARGLLLLAWGLRSGDARIARVLALGADGVFVDDVESMVRVMGAHRLTPAPARP